MITKRHGAIVSEDERNWKICGVTGLMLFFSSLSRIFVKMKRQGEGDIIDGYKEQGQGGREKMLTEIIKAQESKIKITFIYLKFLTEKKVILLLLLSIFPQK